MTVVATLDVPGDPRRPNVYFTPFRVASALLWFDARNAAYVGDGTWQDAIAGVTLAQTLDASKPDYASNAVGGTMPGLTFDGTDDYLEGAAPEFLPSGTEPGWFFALVDQQQSGADATANRYLAGYGTTGKSRVVGKRYSTTNKAYAGNQTGVTGTTAFQGVCVIFAQFTATDITVWLNGTQEATGASTPATELVRLRLGAGANAGSAGYWQGAIGQVVMGAGALSTGQRQDLEGWGARIAGILAKLPNDHPRKSGTLF